MARLCNLTYVCFTLFIFIFSSSALGQNQVVQTHRFEKKQRGADNYFTVISLKNEGLALLRQKDEFNNGKQVSELIFLDTALQEKRTINFEIENRNHLVGHEYAPGHLYLLYRTGETNKNSVELIDFNIKDGDSKRYEIKPELDFKLTHFVKAGNSMILGGYVSKDPVILVYGMTTNLIKVVPGFFQNENELVDLRTNQNQTFNTVLIDRSAKTEKKFIFKTFDETGELLIEDVVPIDHNKSLQTCITSTLIREELMVMGTWSDRQSKQSSGFFTLAVDPFNEQKINYIDFAKLNHYLDYIKPSRAHRIKESSEKDIQAGRNPAFANYVMPFKIEERKNGFIMLAEVYTPMSSNPYNNAYNNPMAAYGPNPYFYNPYMLGYYYPGRMYRPYNFNNNIKNADEIRTTQAVLLVTDGNGNPVMDRSMKIEDIRRSALEQVSEFHYANGNVIFFYKNKENELIIKTIPEQGDVIETKQQIKLLDPLDEFRSEKEDSALQQWHENSFYVWGYQTIRNINKAERIRDVFYINKIIVQ